MIAGFDQTLNANISQCVRDTRRRQHGVEDEREEGGMVLGWWRYERGRVPYLVIMVEILDALAGTLWLDFAFLGAGDAVPLSLPGAAASLLSVCRRFFFAGGCCFGASLLALVEERCMLLVLFADWDLG